VNQGSEVPEYAPGDQMELQLTVEHDFKLERVSARFEHRHATPDSPDRYRIDLTTSGSGGMRRPSAAISQRSDLVHTPPGATSTVSLHAKTLHAKINGTQVPGEYRCTRIQTRGPGGSSIPFEQVPDIRFRVVEEREERPRVVGVEFKQ
jgi:hypothetical protein